MLDVYFSPFIDLTELEKDENVTITDNEIIIDCYGGNHSAAIGEIEDGKVFHLYGWNMAVYYYLYENYGYVFGQDVFECFYVYNPHPDLAVDGPVFKYMCLDEMKSRLLSILNGKDDELLHRIDADMDKLRPDFVKRVKDLGIEKCLPTTAMKLVLTDEEMEKIKEAKKNSFVESITKDTSDLDN